MTISVADVRGGYHQDPKLDESAIAGVLPDTGSLKNEQARIEGQLTSFEKSLWYQPDTTQVAVDSKSREESQKERRKRKRYYNQRTCLRKESSHCQGSESRKIRSGTQCSTQKIKTDSRYGSER